MGNLEFDVTVPSGANIEDVTGVNQACLKRRYEAVSELFHLQNDGLLENGEGVGQLHGHEGLCREILDLRVGSRVVFWSSQIFYGLLRFDF